MPDFTFGDIICLGDTPGELTALSNHVRMYVSRCAHKMSSPNLFPIGDLLHVVIPAVDPSSTRLGVFEVQAAGWQLCRHVVDSEGYLLGDNPAERALRERRVKPLEDATVTVDGVDVTDKVTFKEHDGYTSISVDENIEAGGVLSISYRYEMS